MSRHQGVPIGTILEVAFFISVSVLALVIQGRISSGKALAAWTTQIFLLFLGTFSWLYSLDGSSKNFSHALSHLDAFYFALGTLSTAGTGNLSATSESARSIQAVEMATGMALILIGVATIVTRLTNGRSGRRAPQSPE